MKVDPRLRFPHDLHEVYQEIGRNLSAVRGGSLRVLGGDVEEPIGEMERELLGVKTQFMDLGLWSEAGEDADTDGDAGPEMDPAAARAYARTRVVAAQVGRLLKMTKVLLSEPGTQYDPETGDALVKGREGVEYLTYVERGMQENAPNELVVTPIEVGPLVAPALRKIGKVVITSATIATGTNVETAFDYTMRQFGLGPSSVAARDIVASPFDYPNCSTLYIDEKAPVRPGPSDDKSGVEAWYDYIAKESHDFLCASKGGAFILCCSRDDLNGIADALRDLVTDDYRIGIQDRSDDASVSWFKENPRSVLLGLKSLWEGVDVPGMGLRMVIIPRLPFPNYGDILLKTRKDRYSRALMRQGVEEKKVGYRAFSAFDVNICAEDLAQGFGRLIRHESDMGLAVCLDPRLATKPYAGILQATIPIKRGKGADKQRMLKFAEMCARIAGA